MTATQTLPSATRPETDSPQYTEVRPPEEGTQPVRPVKPRRINLLPPEIGKQRAAAKVKFYVIGGLGALVLVLAGVWMMKSQAVSSAKEELATEQDQIAAIQTQIDDPALQEVVQKQADVSGRSTALSGAVAGEVSLPALLNQLAIVIPDGTWLTSLNFTGGGGGAQAGASASATATQNPGDATATAPAPTTGTTQPAGGTLGTLQVNGSGLGNSKPECSHDVSAMWLQTMEAWPAITSVWVSSSTKSGSGLCNVVGFTSDMEIGSSVASGRSSQYAASGGAGSGVTQTTGGTP